MKTFNTFLIGDIHATQESLSDCEALIDFVRLKSNEKKCKNLIFLGDLFHTHSVINSSVLSFWKETFDLLLSQDFTTYVLIGNHDRAAAGNDGPVHSLRAFENYHKNLIIVNKPIVIDNNIFAIPHYYNADTFLTAISNIHDPSTIFSHETFDGAVFENGFYAKDGINVSSSPHKFISGHIHTKCKFDNVIYIGAPRWLTANDANQSKSIAYAEINGPNLVVYEEFDTAPIVTPIYAFDDLPELPAIEQKTNLVNTKCKIIINIRGPENFINKRLNYYNKLRELAKATFSIRTFPIKETITEVKESEGIHKAFQQYFQSFTPKFNSDKVKLFKLIEERADFLLK